MLIWLDESVADADFEADVQACCAVEDLYASVYRGEHFVIAKRAILDKLAKTTSFSSSTRGLIKKSIAEYSVLAAFAQCIQTKLLIKYGLPTGCSRVSDSVWELDLVGLGKSGVSSSILLGENIEDAKLFEHAAKQYRVANKLFGEVSLEHSAGGGSQTPPCLNNLVSNVNRWVFCVCDSDRLGPGQDMDATAKKCAAIAAGKSIVCAFYDIPSREVENIIPRAFLAEAIPVTHQYAWDSHVSQICEWVPSAHDFGDLKNGTSLRKILTYKQETPVRAFWMQTAKTLIEKQHLGDDCFDAGTCLKKDDKPCECLVVQGFGEALLKTVCEYLSGKSAHAAFQLLKNDPNVHVWREIGKRAYEWGCASPRVRVS